MPHSTATDYAQLYRVLAETAPDAIITIDEHSVLLSANPAAERLFGYPVAALVGHPLTAFMPERMRHGHHGGMARYLATGERRIPWSGVRVPVRRRDGTEVPVEISFGEFVTGGRRIFSGILRDISDRVAAERAVTAARAEAERRAAEADEARARAEIANRAKADFLAVMSHELRTPLNAISGYAELLAMGIRGPVTPEQAEDLRRIQQSQRHLLGLVNEVLNHARLETGRVYYDVADVPLAAVVGSVEPLVAPQLAAKGLAYSRDGCAASSLVARADAEKVRQVLLNVLSNAVKFTAPGGRVQVVCAAAGDRVLVRVHDTGIGIRAEHLTSIFEPFVQVDSSLTRTHEGAGLGLAISRDLARGMGGDLTAESTAGAGSTFTLALPRSGG